MTERKYVVDRGLVNAQKPPQGYLPREGLFEASPGRNLRVMDCLAKRYNSFSRQKLPHDGLPCEAEMKESIMKIENLKTLNTEAMAYMGDAVFEQFVRERLLARGLAKPTNLHRTATRYVKAGAQADVIRTVFDELSEEDQRLVKRARNHRYNSKAKNADPITYKWATAFEALVGNYYLAENYDKLYWIMNRAMEIVDGRMADGK